MIARRLRLPYTVGLVAAGIALGFLPGAEKLTLTRELVFSFLLPPLVFEAAIHISWAELRQEFWLVLSLATIGLAVAAVIVCFGMTWLLGWPIATAAVFACLISATDPVSVVAAMKEAGARGPLRTVIESESLFNDGTAAVAFGIAVELVSGVSVSPLGAASRLVQSAGLGLVAGVVVAAVGLFIIGQTKDHLVEIAITLAIAYGSFLLADSLNASGVLAAVASGLVTGSYGRGQALSVRGGEAVDSFWEFAAFAANSVVFLVIGVQAARGPIGHYIVPAAIAIAFVLFGRVVSVFAVALGFSKSSMRVTSKGQKLLIWGGLRGALALALALSVPNTLPGHTELIVVTLCVVVFSVVVQGITIRPLIVAATDPKG